MIMNICHSLKICQFLAAALVMPLALAASPVRATGGIALSISGSANLAMLMAGNRGDRN
jgi:hypothetical protein